jgi:cytidylate kinase
MNTVITIGRQSGSGGRIIGKAVAEKYGIPYYDKELLEIAAKDSGYCKEIFENHDEKPTNSFLYSLVMDSSFGLAGTAMNEMPLNHKIFLAQFDTIRKIAAQGPCVMVGRCADYALENTDNHLSVFIHAKTEDRISRLMEEYSLSENKAEEMIIKTEKARSSYYNYYTNKTWGAAESYSLCLDSSVFGTDGCVDMIVHAVETKENRGHAGKD